MLLLLSSIIGLLPLPKFGAVIETVHFSGSGYFVEEPHRMVIWLFSYFLILSIVEPIVEKNLPAFFKESESFMKMK